MTDQEPMPTAGSQQAGEAETRRLETELKTHVTRILQEFSSNQNASEELLPLVYGQLRAIAQKRMNEERGSHTLQATALVHEAYLRLVGSENVGWENRRHFFAIAAEAMRRVLIDHARKRDSKKRGGGRTPMPLSVVDLASDACADDVLALDEALTQLEGEDARAAQVVQLRFFAGLSVEETADVMNISERTVMREWSFARARLYQLLGVAGQ